ncbi:MAG TPA: hypothetical protein VJ898_05225 [Natrialbaceae archaeon]|jgi:hypothetical protein|nr:hypothetical protein [Natrialbaceae archaeon]
MVNAAAILLILLRLVLFALALGMTLVSFQAYWNNRSKRLESAFIGFAFISMGVALTNISTQVQTQETLFHIVETIPFIIGFTMLWASLYR